MPTSIKMDNDLISLYQELKTSITSFYSTHSVLHANGTIDMQEVLNKMSKVDLFLAGNFKGLWEMERTERLKQDDLSTIKEEDTVILNPEECSELAARRAEAKREKAYTEELRAALEHARIHAEGVREGVYREELRAAIDHANVHADCDTQLRAAVERHERVNTEREAMYHELLRAAIGDAARANALAQARLSHGADPVTRIESAPSLVTSAQWLQSDSIKPQSEDELAHLSLAQREAVDDYMDETGCGVHEALEAVT